MNREFLEAQGLSKEVIDKVMVEHGKSIQAEQLKAKEVKEQAEKDLKEAQSTITKMQKASDDAEKSQKLADDYKEKYETAAKERDDIQRSSAIKEALIVNGANEKYYSTLSGLLGEDVSLDSVNGEVAKLKASHGELFQAAQPADKSKPGYQIIDNKLKTGETPGTMTKDDILAIKDKRERQQKIAQNLDLFN